MIRLIFIRASAREASIAPGHVMTEVQATTFQSERLVLEPLRPDDADEMCTVLGDPALHEHVGGRPLALAELRERYRRLAGGRSDDGAQLWLNWIVRLRETGAAVGTVQATLTRFDSPWQAQIAWVVGVGWQRRGIASEAARCLVAWLGERGIHSVSAAIHPHHVASERVAARAGLCATDEVMDGERVWRRP
jgi:RimJ/RimL family protein N-acetyltransferase